MASEALQGVCRLALAEFLERFTQAGLVQDFSLTRMPPGSAVIAKNCDIGRRDSISKRGGYRRWRDIDMGRMITLVTVIGDESLIIAGDVDVRDV